jgi:hypothetical protein
VSGEKDNERPFKRDLKEKQLTEVLPGDEADMERCWLRASFPGQGCHVSEAFFS